MPANLELTLQQLAKIALGTPELTHINIEILHSLINMILKKLDCQNEKVSMCGLEGKCLDKILGKSKPSSLSFNDEHLEQISLKLDRVIELEERVAVTADKLEQHLMKIEQCQNIQPIPFDIHEWPEFASAAVKCSRCLQCSELSDLSCRLLNYKSFLTKIQRRIAAPFVNRHFILEEKVKKLHDNLAIAAKRAAEKYEKLALIDGCMLQIEKLGKKVDLDFIRFLKVMEEIQEMLDLKSNKICVPAMKHYITAQFRKMGERLSALQEESPCPKETGVISMGVTCLSCGGRNLCVDVGVYPLGVMPDWLKRNKSALPKVCTCRYSSGQQYIAELPENLKTEANEGQGRQSSKIKVPEVCGLGTCSSFHLIEGTDGSLYRRG